MTDLGGGLAARVARLLGGPVKGGERLRGGRNSRVSRVDLADGRSVAVKEYFTAPGDARDRLGVEFGALTFLRLHGVCNVPAPLARDGADLGIYEWKEGTPAGRTPCAGDVEAMADFLLRLAALAGAARKAGLPAASDACFSFAGTVAAVRARLARFAAVADRDFHALRRELEHELDEGEAAGRARLAGRRLDPGAELSPGLHTLSPSDFGLHNALRSPGGLCFVDFEFCGLDDPAKMAADILLHPGMDLSRQDAATFVRLLAQGLSGDADFTERLRDVFLLHGVKWCLIACNEFLDGERARRDFAKSGGADALARSLARARAMLAALRGRDDLWRPPLAAID